MYINHKNNIMKKFFLTILASLVVITCMGQHAYMAGKGVAVFYPANYDASASLREVMNDVAEFNQCIYYIGSDNNLKWKRMTPTQEVALRIRKSDYFELNSGSAHSLCQIAKTTELGDNISSPVVGTGNV